MDHKDSTRKALENFSRKAMHQPKKRTTKNKKPEKDVEKEVLTWARSNGWSLDVIDAAGGSNIFGGIAVKSGYCDLSGTMPITTPEFGTIGIGAFLELKASGKRSTLKPHQREFLVEKINAGAFATCTDGVLHLQKVQAGFLKAKDKKAYLISMLPKDSQDKYDQQFGGGLGLD